MSETLPSEDRVEPVPPYQKTTAQPGPMKNQFPFRLGTTSFILRDDILPNVHYLKDKVDHIELLVFEPDEQSNYPSPEMVAELNAVAADHDLTYTVHLPIGIHLGTRDILLRKKNVATFLRAIDATRPLNPHAWDLHLEPDEGSQTNPIHDLAAWQDSCFQSLEELKSGGADPLLVGLETLEYPFEYAEPVVNETGFGICLDIGHCWYRGYDEDWFIKTLLPKARSFHLHGFDNVRDHRGLNHVPIQKLKRFINSVAAQPDVADRVVSIEVFGEKHLTPSLEVLHELA
ncbi:MAG: cobamide remodeling phosphodiesterase CbiR [Pontiella sp.]